eukprot:SAG31_NODE_4331_length_3346_cov_1.723745_2_plen_194_part_00
MPLCCACEQNKRHNAFSGNQLKSRASPRCKQCITSGYTAGHAKRNRQAAAAREQAAAAAAAAAAEAAAAAAAAEQEARERAERERVEQEQRERAAAEERERRERAARDAARESQLRLKCVDLRRAQGHLDAVQRRVAVEVAAMPPAQRQRVRTDPWLYPIESWPFETALRWFDETFSFSDLCRSRKQRFLAAF